MYLGCPNMEGGSGVFCTLDLLCCKRCALSMHCYSQHSRLFVPLAAPMQIVCYSFDCSTKLVHHLSDHGNSSLGLQDKPGEQYYGKPAVLLLASPA